MFSVYAQDYLALQGSVTGATTGDVVVEIYDAASGGNLLYSSGTDFNGAISSGRYDILLGNGTQPLSLNYGNTYYMDITLAGKEMDFNGNDRQVFQSPVGNLTTSRPIKTTSTSPSALNVNDLLNISGDGNLTTAAGIIIKSTDADDALNVSAGGSYFKGNAYFYQGINARDMLIVSPGMGLVVVQNSNLRIASSDNDDALNVSAGGAYFGGSAIFNFPATFNTIYVNDKTIINSNDNDDALNVTSGGSVFVGKVSMVNADNDDTLNLSGGGEYIKQKLTVAGRIYASNNDLNDTLNISTGGSYFGGPIISGSVDMDDALNLTSGGVAIRGQQITIGYNESNAQNHLDIYDGGNEKCSYITLYDDGGTPWYFWVNRTGDMRIGAAPGGPCNTSGESVGSQP